MMVVRPSLTTIIIYTFAQGRTITEGEALSFSANARAG
jgi:hypothetical protein